MCALLSSRVVYSDVTMQTQTWLDVVLVIVNAFQTVALSYIAARYHLNGRAEESRRQHNGN